MTITIYGDVEKLFTNRFSCCLGGWAVLGFSNEVNFDCTSIFTSFIEARDGVICRLSSVFEANSVSAVFRFG